MFGGRKSDQRRGDGNQPSLSTSVEQGPEREMDGIVRWRRIELQWVIKRRFGARYMSSQSATFCASSTS